MSQRGVLSRFMGGDQAKEPTRKPRHEIYRSEERVAEIRSELVVGEMCSGTVPAAWESLQEELLDELAERESALPGEIVIEE